MTSKKSTFVCFEKQKISLSIALSPEAVSDPILHIKKQMNLLLFRYSNELKGVLLNYSDELNFKTDMQYARIVGEFPWLHVHIQTKCLVFKPYAGMLVSGNVLKVMKFHIR